MLLMACTILKIDPTALFKGTKKGKKKHFVFYHQPCPSSTNGKSCYNRYYLNRFTPFGSTHFEVLGLLSKLQHMLAVEFTLAPVVVLNLVLQLCLVLLTDQVHTQFLQHLQLPVFQLLHGLIMADQHGMFHLFLGLLLVQLLGTGKNTKAKWRPGYSCNFPR